MTIRREWICSCSLWLNGFMISNSIGYVFDILGDRRLLYFSFPFPNCGTHATPHHISPRTDPVLHHVFGGEPAREPGDWNRTSHRINAQHYAPAQKRWNGKVRPSCGKTFIYKIVLLKPLTLEQDSGWTLPNLHRKIYKFFRATIKFYCISLGFMTF